MDHLLLASEKKLIQIKKKCRFGKLACFTQVNYFDLLTQYDLYIF
jgi:hypothetical protein